MNNKPTLTIAIPAYNEEANIGFLLTALLAQKITIASLEKIVVVSDASTDKTVHVVRSVNDSRIFLIDKKEREGAYKAQNQIVQDADSDVLVILNADTMPRGDNFLEELVRPIIDDPSVGLTTPYSVAVYPEAFFEKILAHSHELKRAWYLHMNGGNNLYMCHGIGRAFSRAFYSQLTWPMDVPEDAYSYFACLESGFKFVCAQKAVLRFRVPSHWSDHVRQSTRFFGGKDKMAKLFPPNIVYREYRIPLSIKLRYTLPSLIFHPILTVMYAAIGGFILYFMPKNYQAKWQIAYSTKKAIHSEDIAS